MEHLWPPELDAVVADPAHHRLAFENESVRVLETVIKKGDRTQNHTHQWPAATFFLSWSDFIRRDDKENVLLDTKEAGMRVEPGQAVWTPPLGPHTLENVGDGDVHVITVEVKRAL